MAKLKVFVSSTCYDLNIVRSQLRNFILNYGYDPVMSDYSDVLYDPRIHTHSSCVQEVNNCDMLILIVGSRFGGKAIPKAVDMVDFDSIKSLSRSTDILENKDNISITQLEVLKGIELSIPIFTFIDEKVLHDHLVYEKNKKEKFINLINFPSFQQKPETAEYIFEFINFLRHRLENNTIIKFSKMEEIEEFLKKQWSGLFQRLLYEQRIKDKEEKRMDYLTNEIADIKTAIMTSISSTDLKDTARGAIKYRRLIEFISQLKGETTRLLSSNYSWKELLSEFNIDQIKRYKSNSRRVETLLILEDKTYYECSYSDKFLERLKLHWEQFKELSKKSRKAIIDAVIDNDDFRRPRFLKYVNEPYSELDQLKFKVSIGEEK